MEATRKRTGEVKSKENALLGVKPVLVCVFIMMLSRIVDNWVCHVRICVWVQFEKGRRGEGGSEQSRCALNFASVDTVRWRLC